MQVDVWSDFVCPWCYLVSTSLDKLKESHGIEVVWHSYELRPKGSPPMPEAYKARIEAHTPQMEAMAREHYGIEIKRGRLGTDSRPALIGQKFAEQHGKGEAYHKAVFEAYWLDAQPIDDLDVLTQIAESVGLEKTAFLDSLHSSDLEALVDADIAEAQGMNITGVPALVFNGRYLIPGAQPYPELVNIVEYIRKKDAAV
jgi:predicted DsbA family dithiol-disulfide isomerase